MAIAHGTIEVGTTAVNLLTGVPDRGFQHVDNSPDRTVVLINEGAVEVYLGGPGVTDSDYGYPLAPGGEVAVDLVDSDVLWAVVAAGTATVRALHLGV